MFEAYFWRLTQKESKDTRDSIKRLKNELKSAVLGRQMEIRRQIRHLRAYLFEILPDSSILKQRAHEMDERANFLSDIARIKKEGYSNLENIDKARSIVEKVHSIIDKKQMPFWEGMDLLNAIKGL